MQKGAEFIVNKVLKLSLNTMQRGSFFSLALQQPFGEVAFCTSFLCNFVNSDMHFLFAVAKA